MLQFIRANKNEVIVLESIGERIKNTREKQGMTQKKLSTLSQISLPSIRAYEQGKRNPKLDNVIRIAEALGLSASYLMGNTSRVDGLDLVAKENGSDPESFITKVEKETAGLLNKSPEYDQVLKRVKKEVHFKNGVLPLIALDGIDDLKSTVMKAYGKENKKFWDAGLQDQEARAIYVEVMKGISEAFISFVETYERHRDYYLNRVASKETNTQLPPKILKELKEKNVGKVLDFEIVADDTWIIWSDSGIFKYTDTLYKQKNSGESVWIKC